MFNYAAELCLPMFITVYSCLFYYEYPTLLVFIYVYTCLPMFTRLLMFTYVPIFTPVYSCLPKCTRVLSMFKTSYSWLPMFTNVNLLLSMFTTVYSHSFPEVYPCSLVFTYVYTFLPMFTLLSSCLSISTRV